MAEEAKQPALSEALTAEINEFSEGIWNHYISSRTEEQYAADNEKTKKFFGDEEYKNSMMAKMAETFNNADANNDGLLNREEFQVYGDALKQ